MIAKLRFLSFSIVLVPKECAVYSSWWLSSTFPFFFSFSGWSNSLSLLRPRRQFRVDTILVSQLDLVESKNPFFAEQSQQRWSNPKTNKSNTNTLNSILDPDLSTPQIVDPWHRLAGSANPDFIFVIAPRGEMASFPIGMTPFLLEIDSARGTPCIPRAPINDAAYQTAGQYLSIRLIRGSKGQILRQNCVALDDFFKHFCYLKKYSVKNDTGFACS